MKKEILQKILQGWIRLSYVVLKRDFNVNLKMNKLVNLSRFFKSYYFSKNAILNVIVRAFREVFF
ncbi:hypothetical protein COI87_20135 [Bacillus thuringiensis]|nr:hypothetical protein CN355_01015 [Bacillus thuringiensis]PFJ09939.1 hypothetical protein COI87_20135 [Bacillus thuringiensis]PGX85335.1 hypothetical protein COE45_05745 [Bacillus thuringiensis]